MCGMITCERKSVANFPSTHFTFNCSSTRFLSISEAGPTSTCCDRNGEVLKLRTGAPLTRTEAPASRPDAPKSAPEDVRTGRTIGFPSAVIVFMASMLAMFVCES